MAREETIQVKIDKTGAEQSLRDLKSQADALKSTLANLDTALIRQQNTIAQGNQRHAAAMRNLGNAIGQVNQNQAQNLQYMAQYIRQQQDLGNAQVTATGATRNAAGEFQTYRAAVAGADGATHNYRVAVNTATGEVYRLDQGIRSTSVSLRNISSIMRSIQTIVGFTGVAQSMRYALSEMKAMSDEMVTYRKVTGATAQEMERIRSSAYSTAKKYGQTPSDFLSAASEMARAGYGQNSVAMAELATKTQLVGDMTAEAASKFLLATDAGYKYQGNIESLTAVLDAANEVDNNFATSIEKISEGMTLVASLAGSVHVPVEQLIAALGTMTAATQRSGAEMARGLRSIMLNVLGDTTTEIEEGVTVTEENIQSLTDALDKYGDSSVAAARKAGKLINPMQAISSLAKAWKAGKLDESTLFGISKDIAGQRYYNAFSSLIQNYDMYEAMLEKIAGSAGSAQKEVDNMLDSWTVKANQLKTAWTELVNSTISEGFIKGLLDGGIAALEFAGNLENLALMAGGAYETIRSLMAGMRSLRNNGQFGAFNIGMGAIGLSVTAIGAWKAAYEKNIQDIQSKAAETARKAIEETTKITNLEDIKKQYDEIMQDGLQAEQGEIEKLQTLQEQLNGLVGDQASAIDLVNGKYSETKKALKELSVEQLRATKNSLVAARASIVNSFSQTDLNGFWEFGGKGDYSYSGVGLPWVEDIEDLVERIDNSRYLSAMTGESGFGKTLGIKKPEDADEILEFLGELEDLYNYIGSSEAATKYAVPYNALGTLIKNVKDAAGDLPEVQEQLTEIEKQLTEAENDLGEAQEKTAKSSGQETEALNEQAKAAETLSDAIDEATNAKEKFDDAMKVSKADAMNGYIEAFETLKKEIEAGRVNSTAFYASARMLMGETAYNATGGSSEAVMAALNRRGESGSLLDAEKILNQTYYNGETGQAIEGYGIYQLLSQTKWFDQSRLTNAEGYATIPNLSDADVQRISESWGGLSENLITSWLNAFDQYDRKGEATDASVQAKKTEEDQLGENAKTAAESLNTLAENADKVAQAFGQFPDDLEEEEIHQQDFGAQDIADTIADGIKEGFDEGTKTAAKQADKLEKETESISENALDQYASIGEKFTALLDAIQEADGNVDEAIESLGTSWEEIASIMQEGGFKGVVDVQSAKDALDEFVREYEDTELTFGMNADPSKAIKTADAAIREINKKSATIQIGAKDNTGGATSGGLLGNLFSGLFGGLRLAGGTKGHPGGPAIVNDGNGPELIVDRGRAFIAGNGNPTMVNLTRGAKVFTASETRGILTGSGAPAYAMGIEPLDGGGGKASGGTSALQQWWNSVVSAFKPSGVTTTDPKGKAAEEDTPKGSTGSGGGNAGNEKQTDEKAFGNLKDMIDYILDRMEEGLNEQIDILDKEIDALKLQRDAAKEQNELEEKQKAVADAQKDLEEALGERTVRYLGDDGKWHWMADARNVEKAKEALADAEKDLAEYEEERTFEAQVEALEKQKEALQEEYSKYAKEWEAIQKGVNTPTGTIEELIAAVLSGGTPQEQTGASAVRDYLIGTLLQGGRFKGNYNEALDAIAKATAGTPIMPDGTTGALAALIATGGGLTGNVADALRAGNSGTAAAMAGPGLGGGTTINYNYFVNGMQIGSDAATGMSISELMQSLTVYAGQ